MALEERDLEQIGEYVKLHISDWLAEKSLGKPPVVYEVELRERMVRVEEELKHQRELMREGFERMDERFTAMRIDMDKRFEQVDRRFESVQQDIRGLEQRMDRFMRWSVTFTLATGGLIIGILKLWL